MRTIYKYTIENPVFELDLPKDSKVLSVQVQDSCPVMWVLQDPANQKQTWVFKVYGTGHLIHDDANVGEYLGTWQQSPYVWHLFARVKQ